MTKFKLELKKDFPRTTTRKQYKEISRWLRVCTKEIGSRIGWESCDSRFYDAAVYGTPFKVSKECYWAKVGNVYEYRKENRQAQAAS